MPSYGSIPDSQIDADSPIISDTFFKLRDNPLAIAEGASGAPKVQRAALSEEAQVITEFARTDSRTLTTTFNHGFSTTRTVHFLFAANYTNGGGSDTLQLSIGGTLVYDFPIQQVGMYSTDLAPGDHTIVFRLEYVASADTNELSLMMIA